LTRWPHRFELTRRVPINYIEQYAPSQDASRGIRL